MLNILYHYKKYIDKGDKNMTYKNCKKVIESGNYDYESMCNMLDTFLLRKRINQAQYDELMDLMDSKM